MFVDIDYNKFQNEMNESLRQIFTESYEYQPEVSAEEFAEEQKHKDELYNKIKRILDCPEMEKCHPYLYSLDRENVFEEDEQKILKLYDCGIKRGLIHEDECEEDQVIDNGEVDCDDDSLCGGPEDSLTNQPLTDNPMPYNKTPESSCFTVLYSANKNGISKMGPFYSHATTEQGASEECIKFLNDNGYTDVEVMAIDHNAVDTEDGISQEFQDDRSFEMYEDDSEEFEKQETGDTSDEDAEVEVKAEENPEKDVKDVADDVQKDEVEVKDDKVEDVDVETKDDEKKDTDKEDEKTEEVKDEDKTEDKEEEDKTEDKEEDGENKEEKKLTADEKSVLKEEYTKIFKDVLGKTGLEKSIDDMTLEERTSFYETLAEKWTKNDPSEFMSAKEQAELNKKVVKNK